MDLKTLQQVKSIKTSQPFWSMAVSRDGRRVYATNPWGRSILVIDTVSYQESEAITGVGASPAYMVVIP